MKKRVNLMDKSEAMELLRKLHATEGVQEAQNSTIYSRGISGTTGKERGHMVYRMGLQPVFNKGFDNPHPERREKK